MSQYIAFMIAASVAALAIWVAVFHDQDLVRLLVISIFLFAVPISFLVIDNYVIGLLWWVPYVLFVGVEEILKLIGSKLARSDREAFSLVLLFGIWEIAITKTVRVPFQDDEFYAFLNNSYVVYSIVSLTSVFMHTTTAAIYAVLRRNIWIIPFSLSMVLHLLFNYTRDFYFWEKNGEITINVGFGAFDAVGFVVIWLAIWLFYRRARSI